MLLDLLARYLGDVESAVRRIEGGYVERYEEEIIADNRANLRIRVRFQSGYLLELNEAVIVESEHIMHLAYRYHFQDGQNNLIFRYDNAPHFSELKTYPHHKHLPDRVIESYEPFIIEVIKEARCLGQSIT